MQPIFSEQVRLLVATIPYMAREYRIPNAANLPAVRWKLHNLAAMQPAQHQQALAKLERALATP